MSDEKNGLYIEGVKADYKGELHCGINSPTVLVPSYPLAPGLTAEVWHRGRLVATFVSARGRATDPMLVAEHALLSYFGYRSRLSGLEKSTLSPHGTDAPA